jgi:hypothetical protein
MGASCFWKPTGTLQKNPQEKIGGGSGGVPVVNGAENLTLIPAYDSDGRTLIKGRFPIGERHIADQALPTWRQR